MALAAFLFTDIVGSTAMWTEAPESMRRALEAHDRLMRDAVERAGGTVFKHTGDGCCAVFTSPAEALVAAASAQIALAEFDWPEGAAIRARMGVHVGEAEARNGDWFGPTLNRCARLMSIANGGQVVASGAVKALVGPLQGGLSLRDLGTHGLRGFAEPERVWQLCGPGLVADFGPLRSLEGFRGRLPATLTSFIGRDEDQRRLAYDVQAIRLVSLVGAGGMGKSRLAVEIAARVVDEFPDGVWFVPLAPLTNGSPIDHALATTLGFQSQGGGTLRELNVAGLAQWRCLLVLDNCEHVLDSARSLVRDLLDRCPGVSVLATSRSPLRVDGEHVHDVRPLDAATDGAHLLIDRATAVRSSFTTDATGLVTAGAICRRLDGMPLAIELAAARLRSMNLSELLDRLDQRFRLLGAESMVRDGDRHATLAAVVDWSYGLLTARQQKLFRALGVFAGGFDLAAAHAIWQGVEDEADGSIDELDTLEVLEALVDQSLVQTADDLGRTRYTMLETMRQYADGLLGAEERRDLRARHADHYLRFARTADARLGGPEQATWLRRLETEHDNLRAALTWAVGADGDAATALGLSAALGWFWRVYAHLHEGRQWYRQVLTMPRTEGDARERASALTSAGLLSYFLGDADDADAHLAEARDLATASSDDERLGWALHGLGRVALDRQRRALASRYLTESIRAFERCGDHRGQAYSLYFTASVAGFDGDAETAERVFDEAIAKLGAAGDIWALCGAHTLRASHATATGHQEAAARDYRIALENAVQLGSKWMASVDLFGLARTAARLERWELALRIFGAADALCESLGSAPDRAGGPSAARLRDAARQALGPEASDRAWADGHGRSFDDVVAMAFAAADEMSEASSDARPRPGS